MSSLHEWSVLGFLLNNNDMLDTVVSRISDEHFIDIKARKVFGIMKEMRDFELHTLSPRISDHNSIELLISHGDEIVTAKSIPGYCKVIIEDYILRQQTDFVQNLLTNIGNRNLSGLTQLYEDQLGKLQYNTNLNGGGVDGYSFMSEYEAFIVDLDNPQRTDLLPFYMPTINKSLGYGVPPGSLVMLSGSPKDGKSTIALQQTWWLAEKAVPAAFISFEQRTRELFEIMVGQRAKVSGIKIRNRSLDDTQRNRVEGMAKYLSLCPIYALGLDKTDPIHCFEQIRRLAENGVKWITLDHLQLMCDGSGEGGYTYKVKDIVRRLKLLAGQLGIVIMLIAQNQTSAEGNTVRTWGSNVPEQDCDAWLVFNRPSKDDPKCHDADYLMVHRNRLPGSKRMYVETLWSADTNQNNEIIQL